MGKEEGGHYCHIPPMRVNRDDGGFWQLHALMGSSCRVSGKNSTLS